MESQKELQLRQSIVNQENTSIKAWFENRFIQKSDYPSEPNWWVGLATVLSQQAMDVEIWDLERLKIAIDIYNSLGDESSFVSAMLLRVSVINKLGKFSASESEDIEEVNNYFISQFNLSLDDAKQKANLFQKGLSEGDIYKHLSNDEALDLRKIKNYLVPIQGLKKDWISKLNPLINKWLDLKSILP
jgi:hypothetical protein